MASSKKIYKRPREDVSDDERDVNRCKERQNNKNRGGRNKGSRNKRNAVRGKENQRLNTKIDFSIFQEESATNAASDGGGIIARSLSLRRLVEALKYYDMVKDDQDSLAEFIQTHYREQMLNDFNYFISEHERQVMDIQKELINDYDFQKCKVENCAFSRRHFEETKANQSSAKDGTDTSKMVAFYSEKFDALHFALFHLFETGYRIAPRPQDDDDGADNDDEKMLQETLSTIRAGRDLCNGTIDRFESDSTNKFNLSIDGETENKSDDTAHGDTVIDSMMRYAVSDGIPRSALYQIHEYLVEADVDSDAAKEDLADSKEHSNIFITVKNEGAFQSMKRFFKASSGMIPRDDFQIHFQ